MGNIAMILYNSKAKTATNTANGDVVEFYCGEVLTADAISVLEVYFKIRSPQHVFIDLATRNYK